MAKKSRKKPARLKTDNAGCMSGLISIFDFRQGRFTRRLLSDKRLGSVRHGGDVHSENKFDVLSSLEEMHEDFTNTVGVKRVNSSKASIKALMAEEMSTALTSNKIPSSMVEPQRVEMCIGANIEKNHKRTNGSFVASPFSLSDPSESSPVDVNLAELMVEFCKENLDCQDRHIESKGDIKDNYDEPQLTENHYILQKALSDMTEALRAHKSVDSKQIICSGYKEAIEKLHLNKDIFLKLLQDPNSLLCKHVQELQKAQNHDFLHGSKHEELSHKQNKLHFFRKREKSDGANLKIENSSQTLKRIVVLKPSPNNISPISSPKLLHDLRRQECMDRASSLFSLKEIKRRLGNVIGESKKERDLIAMDGILHKIPYGNNKPSKISTFLKRGDKDEQWGLQKKANGQIVAHPLDKESVLYEEAKKRLAEMLGLDAKNEVSSPTHVSKSLGRLLSLPEYSSLSPRFSPARDKETIQKIKQDDSTCNGLSSQNIESLPCNGNKSDDESQPINSNSSVLETQLDVAEDLIKKGSTKTEERDSLDTPLEFSTDKPGCIGEICNEEESSTNSVLEPSDEALPMTPSLSVSKLKSSESTVDNLDRPSPVSVLEPLFSEDISSPERPKVNHAELKGEPKAEPHHLNLEEECGDSQLILTPTKFKYVRTVLEASDLNYYKHQERTSDQLLDPFVYDEVEISYGHLIGDSKLLFDCINEVLVEMEEGYLSCTPWISLIKPSVRPLPVGESFVREVCKGVDKHLRIVFPCTLDTVMRKDLECGTWMNVRMEIGGAVAEIGEVILEYIMEETILELWD